MTTAKKLPALIYLGRYQFLYYSIESPQPLTFIFSPEIVRDLEVVNQEILKEQLKAFVTQNNLKPSTITFLLGDDILFTKVVTITDPKGREDEINKLTETVPFDEVSMVQIPFEQSNIVSIANKDYFQAFQDCFEGLEFSTELVLPAFLLAKEVNLAKSADANALSLALKRAIAFKQNDMQEKKITLEQASTFIKYSTTPQTPQEKKRIFILLGVFGVLILILVLVFLWSQNSSKPKPQNTTNQQNITQ